MTERERFEKWANSLELDLTRVDSGCASGEVYSDCNTDYAWMAWQAASAAPKSGHCIEGDGCVCGGDTPRVRATCGNWREPAASPVASAAPAQEPDAIKKALLEGARNLDERDEINGKEIGRDDMWLVSTRILTALYATHRLTDI